MKITDRYDRLMLNKANCKNGYDRLRYVFCATSRLTGQEATFFIELEFLNPLLSKTEVVLGFDSKFDVSPKEIQTALANTNIAIDSHIYPNPSYICVKAGILKAGGFQVANYYTFSQYSRDKKSRNLKVGECIFGTGSLKGRVCVKDADSFEKAAFLCKNGTFEWSLQFNRILGVSKVAFDKVSAWIPTGGKAFFSGEISCDNDVYAVSPASSFGYVEHDWGLSMNAPWFHISACKLTSIISGKLLERSYFAIQGEQHKALSLFCMIGDINLHCMAGAKFHITWDCLEAPDEVENPRLHWSTSFCNSNYILDVDIFCKESDMTMRDYEQPCGQRTLLRLLSGGNGTGEIRLYRRFGKNMELIEHANIENCLCEYGNNEANSAVKQ